MRVVLIHVRDPQFFSVPGPRTPRTRRVRVMGFPPLGVMTLSAVLKQAGHECVVFDQANPETPADVILGEIRRRRPDFVGISLLSTTSYPYARLLARQVRAADDRVRVAVGGVFASLNASRVLQQCPEVDFVARGDGEQLILDLLARLDDPDTVAGLTWREKDGRLRENPDRPQDWDLDRWPFPDREAVAVDYVESMPLDVPAVLSLDRFATVQSSRGCPFQCVFCDIPAFHRRTWRPRSAAHVVAELRHLQDAGYGSVYFVDDHFLLKPRRVEEICAGIRECGVTLRWGCEGRVDSAGARLYPALVKAHCRTLMFGIESGCQKTLDRLGKRQTLAQVEDAVRVAKRSGIQLVHGFFVVGCPDETESDLRETFAFAKRIPLDTFAFNRLCVYRGTPLWDEYVQRGLLDDEADWYKYFKCSAVDPTVLPGEVIHRIRSEEMRGLLIHKLLRYPVQFFRVLRQFTRHMPLRDVLYLLVKPFLGRKSGPTQAEVLSRAPEKGALGADVPGPDAPGTPLAP
jgi:radical SAM superfamily enzyme YgiQ (UPF0313 family)